MDHLAMHIGQPEVTPGISIGKSLVVQTQLVQNCGVQVVEVDFVLDGIIAVFVGFAVPNPGLHPSTTKPHRHRMRVVIATITATL